MIPEHLTELLTAYIDGELAAPKRKEVTRLLKNSAEARRLFLQLKEDSTFLRKLPRTRIDKDLADTVLDQIKMRGLKLAVRQPNQVLVGKPVSTQRFSWIVTVLVAGLMLAAAISLYYFVLAQ